LGAVFGKRFAETGARLDDLGYKFMNLGYKSGVRKGKTPAT